MDLILIGAWLLLSLLVGLIGQSRNIGFWGAFLLSLFLSPLIGFIIALASSSQSAKAPEYLNDIRKGELAENREDFKEAWKHYKDAIFRLDNYGNAGDKRQRKYRNAKKDKLQERITKLEELIQSTGSNNQS